LPFPYRKILCPVDIDPDSADALAHAAALAKNSGGTLYLLHVVQINPLTAKERPRIRRQRLLRFASGSRTGSAGRVCPEYSRAGVKRELAVEVGEPGSLIIATPQRLGADLVVMATRGRRGLKHLVLGSVAERVVRASTVPVLTVRGAAGQ
jgi:nucleotide-binding universal stress UspA family protein